MAHRDRPAHLSKSKFLAGLQCLKRLYLLCYDPQLMPEADDATQARLDQGTLVGELARQAFPNGVLVQEPYWDHEGAVERTRSLMADKNVPAIFEAAFSHDDIAVRVDVLQRMPEKKWRLVEVKATTSVKDAHVPDVAIQKHVVERCGAGVGQCCLMHLNRDYVYEGGVYDLDRLFHLAGVDILVSECEPGIEFHLAAQQETLGLTSPPEVEPGTQCTDPYECEFYRHCNEELPENHITTLYRLRRQRLLELQEMGVEAIDEIPEDFPLSPMQRRIVTCVTEDRTHIDPELGQELEGLTYPLYFMDFETINPAIPRYRGMWSYSMLPFQWSIHVRKAPGEEVEHFAFLAEDVSDPREAFLVSLLEVLERQDGHIVVYNAPFEFGRLADLANWFPTYAERIFRLQGRAWDLLAVIRKHVYHPGFSNSFSIKRVLPALVPDMTYEGMDVSEGGEAGLAFERMAHPDTPEMERIRLRRSLLEYCGQDTLAMVRILDRLKELARQV